MDCVIIVIRQGLFCIAEPTLVPGKSYTKACFVMLKTESEWKVKSDISTKFCIKLLEYHIYQQVICICLAW